MSQVKQLHYDMTQHLFCVCLLLVTGRHFKVNPALEVKVQRNVAQLCYTVQNICYII